MDWRGPLKTALATSFGLGFVPLAPGTVGTAPAVAAYVLVARLAPQPLHAVIVGGLLLAACAGTVWLGPWTEQRWGKKDPGAFVLDEVAGFLLTVLLFRVPSVTHTAIWAFAVTRVFDIAKPPPIRRLERLPAGWGVLVDDLAAAVYAVVALHLLLAWRPAWFGM